MNSNAQKLILLIALFIVGVGITAHGVQTEVVRVIFECEPVLWNDFGYGYSEVWGVIRGDSAPWIHSLHFGWIFLSEESTPESYWIWIENLGWIFSSTERFPEAFYYASNTWILIDVLETTRFRFWDFNSRKWQNINKPGIKAFDTSNQVPDVLQLVDFQEWDHYFSHSLEVGKYIFHESISNGVCGGNHDTIYFYNSDGWFYPYKSLYEPHDCSDAYKGVLFDVRRYRLTIEGNLITVREEDRLWDNSSERTYTIDNP